MAGLVGLAVGGFLLVGAAFFFHAFALAHRCEELGRACGTGGAVLVWLPAAGLLAGLLVAAAGGFRALRRGRPAGRWVAAGWAGLLVPLLLTTAVVAAPPTAAEARHRDAQQAATDAAAADRAAQRLAEAPARPDFEVAAQRHRLLHERIAAAAATAVPGLAWPDLLTTVERDVAGIPLRCLSGSALVTHAASPADLTPAQWTALDAAVRQVAAGDGFTGDGVRWAAGREPTAFRLTAPDGSDLAVNAATRGRIAVVFRSACHLPAAARDAVPAPR